MIVTPKEPFIWHRLYLSTHTYIYVCIFLPFTYLAIYCSRNSWTYKFTDYAWLIFSISTCTHTVERILVRNQCMGIANLRKILLIFFIPFSWKDVKCGGMDGGGGCPESVYQILPRQCTMADNRPFLNSLTFFYTCILKL